MIHYLNNFTTEPQSEIFAVTYDDVRPGSKIQVAISKKGEPVLGTVKKIVESRPSLGEYQKIAPNYFHLTV